jgi:hypothetical protein
MAGTRSAGDHSAATKEAHRGVDRPDLSDPPSILYAKYRDNEALRRKSIGMMTRRILAPLTLLCLGLALGSCSSTSGFVADHWPHWAGGLPADAPPRPGAPGYEEFIAHNNMAEEAQKPRHTPKPGEQAGPEASPQTPPPAPGPAPAPSGDAVRGGGLY